MEKMKSGVKLINVQVEIATEDLGRAKKFYQDNFGFVVKRENRNVVEFDNNILLRMDIDSKPKKSSAGNGVKILFWVGNISLAYKELTDLGIWVDSPPDEDSEMRYFFFQDSEGNICKIMQKK